MLHTHTYRLINEFVEFKLNTINGRNKKYEILSAEIPAEIQLEGVIDMNSMESNLGYRIIR